MVEKKFTLIELLIVIAIIGVLASILVPQIAKTRGFASFRADQSDLKNLYLHIIAWQSADGSGTNPTMDQLISAGMYKETPVSSGGTPFEFDSNYTIGSPEDMLLTVTTSKEGETLTLYGDGNIRDSNGNIVGRNN